MTATLKDIITVALSPVRGVKPSFEAYHIIKTLLILYEKGPMGRQLLSKNLRIGITSVRTLIKRLKSLNLVEIDPIAGCFLTQYGYKVAETTRNVVSNPVEVSDVIDRELLLNEKTFAFLIKRGTMILRLLNITSIRDLVIRYGAKAAIIIYIEDGLAYIPPYREFNENEYLSLKKLKFLLKAEDRDAMVLVFSSSEIEAEKALYSTLLELNILR